jgi:hypothetical protein
MTGRRGATGPVPTFQNKTRFTHNTNSKHTKAVSVEEGCVAEPTFGHDGALQILSIPNSGVCPRCHDQIEWKRKYRKYKPLKEPGSW